MNPIKKIKLFLNNIAEWYKELVFFETVAIFMVIAGLLAILLVGSVAGFSSFLDETKDILDYSEFIGGLVGSLWSLAGVLLFYASLGSQKDELESQKDLLVKQIDEIVKQTEESRKQNVMAKESKDEQTFFQLLGFHNEIIASILLETSEMDFSSGQTVTKTIRGRRSFVEYYDIYKRFFQESSEMMMSNSTDSESMKKVIEQSYGQFSEEYQADLGHYFRNLYNILVFIDGLPEKNRSFFLSLLFAQLSNYEMALLFFHGLKAKNEYYKELLEKYQVLETVPNDEITSMAYKLYDPKAFGEEGFGSNQTNNDSDFDLGGDMPDFENAGMDMSGPLANEINIDASNQKLPDISSLKNKLKGLKADKNNEEFVDDEIDNYNVPFDDEFESYDENTSGEYTYNDNDDFDASTSNLGKIDTEEIDSIDLFASSSDEEESLGEIPDDEIDELEENVQKLSKKLTSSDKQMFETMKSSLKGMNKNTEYQLSDNEYDSLFVGENDENNHSMNEDSTDDDPDDYDPSYDSLDEDLNEGTDTDEGFEPIEIADFDEVSYPNFEVDDDLEDAVDDYKHIMLGGEENKDDEIEEMINEDDGSEDFTNLINDMPISDQEMIKEEPTTEIKSTVDQNLDSDQPESTTPHARRKGALKKLKKKK